MEKLTEAEKDLMEILWKREKAFMKNILEDIREPKPAPTTVATLLKRMQNKGFVSFKLFGNSRQYMPNISKEKYFSGEMSNLIGKFFGNSVTQFASFFTSASALSQKQLVELRDIINQKIEENDR